MRRGVFPGSFNPPTVAHLAIAEAALRRCRLDRVDLVVSRQPLGKPEVERPSFADRVDVLRRAAAGHRALGVVVTDAQLVVDIAFGYDVVILGADKWLQIHDPAFYESPARRDRAIGSLPAVAVVPRAGFPVPDGLTVLDIEPALQPVSSTAARLGTRDWMAPAAAEFDSRTGAWSDPERYDAWSAARKVR